jgi:hypothetical protein
MGGKKKEKGFYIQNKKNRERIGKQLREKK